jgi:hypothetical protein
MIGYLKMSATLNTVNIYIGPYDFPRLFRLIGLNFSFNCLDAIYKRGVISKNIPRDWHKNFIEYILDVPSYYWTPIRKALGKLGMEMFMPSQFIENSAGVLPILSARIQGLASAEYDRMLKASTDAKTSQVSICNF